ncbi:MAG TPA: T9SS type A sorting domain-containing protein [Chitinophagales bacterium]|nr:T9SS type A sorting domain-containing protein [Chitinophagales bacterium]
MKKLFTIFTACLFALFCVAQNLVPNPSFEEMYNCPNSSDQVDSCIGWHRVLNTPDYFTLCSPYPVSVPDNFVGFQFPYDGSSYIGLITYEWWQFYREIVGTQLNDTLTVGNSYTISMRVSRGNWTNQNYNCSASNKLGIRLTTYPYTQSFPPVIDNHAQIYTDSILEDTLNWVLLSAEFIADSSYKYLYLGNFFDDEHTDTAVINAPLGQFGTAYYFIDSINVFCNDPKCITAVSELVNSNIMFDLITKSLVVTSNMNKGGLLNIFNHGGQLIKSNEIAGNTVIDLSDFSDGIYTVQLIIAGKVVVNRISIY